MTERRSLTFASLEEVMPDVERLLAGHTTVGEWSLGQILNHLATAVRLTVEAKPSASPPTREQRVACRVFFRNGAFPEGMSAPIAALRPPADAEAGPEAASLRDFLARFALNPEPFPAHPKLGPMSREQWTRFHCMHCAHHLAFALPRS